MPTRLGKREPTVLVIISVVTRRNLPSQTTITCLIVSVRVGLRVENGLREGQPLTTVILWRIWKSDLCCQKCTQSPKRLVVVSKRGSPVRRHVVVMWSRLEQHRLGGGVHIGCVAGVMPVIDQGPPHRSALPPVIIAIRRRSGQDAWCLSRLISLIECQKIECNKTGGFSNRCCAESKVSFQRLRGGLFWPIVACGSLPDDVKSTSKAAEAAPMSDRHNEKVNERNI